MPTHGPDLSRFNLSQLRELTGRDGRLIKRRLADAQLEPVARDGRTVWYAARPALEAIYLGDALDPARERARFDRVRAERQELELSVERGELIPGEEVDAILIPFCSNLRDRMLGLPHAVAPDAHTAESVAHCERVIDAAVRKLLEDVSHADPETLLSELGDPNGRGRSRTNRRTTRSGRDASPRGR